VGSAQTSQCWALRQDGPVSGHEELKSQPCPEGIPIRIAHSSEEIEFNILQLYNIIQYTITPHLAFQEYFINLLWYQSVKF
jgi:hypothetical protein